MFSTVQKDLSIILLILILNSRHQFQFDHILYTIITIFQQIIKYSKTSYKNILIQYHTHFHISLFEQTFLNDTDNFQDL